MAMTNDIKELGIYKQLEARFIRVKSYDQLEFILIGIGTSILFLGLAWLLYTLKVMIFMYAFAALGILCIFCTVVGIWIDISKMNKSDIEE
jgi:hypothetical protein